MCILLNVKSPNQRILFINNATFFFRIMNLRNKKYEMHL
jgi:hypothetical protein